MSSTTAVKAAAVGAPAVGAPIKAPANAPVKPRMVPLKDITIEGGMQSRVRIDEDTVDEYAIALKEGAKFPPALVFTDGASYWLSDGFHRYFAATKAQQRSLLCEVMAGTKRDAVLHSVGANATHGLRRTNADKRKAVETLLRDPEWGKWSNREIARRCQVSDVLVGQIRDSLTINVYSENDVHTANICSMNVSKRTYVHPKTGEETTMKTGNIGRSEAIEKEPESEPSVNGYVPGPSVKGLGAPVGLIAPHTGETVYYKDNPDVVVDDDPFADEPDAPTKPKAETPKNEDELDDDEWLATLPLTKQLKGDALAIFKADALGWRTLHQTVLGPFKHRVNSAVHYGKTLSHTRGPLLDLVHEAAHVKHPKDWPICPACRGSRLYWMNRQSKQHLEPGTVKSNESNQLEARAQLVNCVACKGGYTLL